MQRCGQSLRVEMGPGSAAHHPGFAGVRQSSFTGERWGFSEVDSRMEAFISGKPVFLNRTKIQPAAQQRAIGLNGKF